MEDGIKHEIMIERNIECDGNIVMASGKIVRKLLFNHCLQLSIFKAPVINVLIISVFSDQIQTQDTGSETSYFGDNELSLPQFRPSGNGSETCSERFRDNEV